MKRVYYPYSMWEDWQNGMWRIPEKQEEKQLVFKAKRLLSTKKRLLFYMRQVVLHWSKSTEMNLTNKGENRQAWLGQAACCMANSVPEWLTREAWNMLDLKTQSQANAIADKVIIEWEQKYLIEKERKRCQRQD